jgi:mannosyl-oligosaccharide alpha-1,2-mannosidase
VLYVVLNVHSRRGPFFAPSDQWSKSYLAHTTPSTLSTGITLPKIQFSFPLGTGADVGRREKVKEAIKRTWDGYVSQGWGWDEVRPNAGGGRDTRSDFLTRGVIDGRNGWGATVVDGMDTLLIAGFWDELVTALNYTVKINFNAPDGLVDPFETIIRYKILVCGEGVDCRYVGGMLSMIDLLEYGFGGPNFDKSGLRALLAQSVLLTKNLAPGYPSFTH